MWKRLLLAAAVGVAGAAALMTRPREAEAATAQQPATTTLTGCLRQGSTSAVFILRGATGGQSEPPGDQLIVSPGAGVALADHLNQRVAVTGNAWRTGGPAAPSGANTVERALPRIEARSLRVVAEKCSMPVGGSLR
ncbi:MAG TPA: hypothetical protein VFV78_13825 [Vicinamibacterales bacterium]|nr:hypothetical protein [Vicinamibacterales bacterium]